ncbi:hypothetical protein HDU97_001133 [Phlyctochytrium planicorne]|nr:hypothetical protein HDU97_001133 [Phlyctochytrium planicorne]
MSKRSGPAGVEDLIHLTSPVSEAAILQTLRSRYSQGQAFTRVGASSLVVVNPVNPLDSCSDTTSKLYADWAKDTGSEKENLPAHIFDLATSVFSHMLREQQDQSVIFVGESGSGKTESRKLFVKQLAALSKSANKKSRVISGAVKSETILEAFGGARTTDNKNSSRYGRYSEYQFDESGKMIGLKILNYLLESPRVVAVPDDERNFNIFYQFLAGATAEERQTFRLGDVSHYNYLANAKISKGYTEDIQKFEKLRNDMKSIGIGKRQQAGIFQTLSAILHLGNINFFDDPNKPGEACEVKNHDLLVAVAEILGVMPVNLEYALTYKTKLIKKELCTVFLTAADAAKQRDALAKALYTLLFGWLVEHINTRLDQDNAHTFVGVVDLSGFQDYRVNHFDQLLCNYGNEILQNFVNQRFFAERHEEYTSESIPSLSIDFPSNIVSCELIGSETEPSLLQIVNAEASRSSSRKADARMVEVFAEELSSNSAFVPGKDSNVFGFAVKHYAGMIEYDCRGFAERNTDGISPDFVTLIRGNSVDIQPTSNTFLRSIFSDKAVSTIHHPRDGAIVTSAHMTQNSSRHPSMKRRKSTGKGGDGATETLFSVVKASLKEMVETLLETVPWVVYCVKPNEDLTGNEFDERTVSAQLKYLGIQKLASTGAVADYTSSYLFDDFIARYRVILEPMRLDLARGPKTACRDFVTVSQWTQKDMAIGLNRVFLAESAWRSLEDELRTIEEALKEEQKARKKAAKAALAAGRRPESLRSFGSFAQGGMHDELESVYSSDAGGNGYYDEEGSYAGDDNESHYGSEFRMPTGGQYPGTGEELSKGLVAPGDVELGTFKNGAAVDGEALIDEAGTGKKKGKKDKVKRKKMSPSRCRWVCCTWCLTWWIPSFCLFWCGMKRPDVRMAFREKVALCIIIFLMCSFLLFFIIVFGRLICPRQQVLSRFELQGYTDTNNVHVYAYGRVFVINEVVNNHVSSYGMQRYDWADYAGQDVSKYFYKTPNFERYCPGLLKPQPGWDNIPGRPAYGSTTYPFHSANSSDGTPRLYFEYMNQFAKARVAWPMKYVASQASISQRLIVIYDNVYDVSTYYSSNVKFLGDNMDRLFTSYYGTDASDRFNDIRRQEGAENAAKYLRCMNNMFYIGTVDHRGDFKCQFSNYILLATTIVVVLVIGVKFFSALQFGSKKEPENQDKFVILQVPCYTEGAESLSRTLESLAMLRYDDKRKLLFVIADGMIIGSGNDRPTPRIVLDILGVDPSIDPEPLSFQSLGEGDKQHNMGKIYSGLFECHGRSVPFVVIVKVGKPSERSRPGNRGKRDSQLVLMRFLNRVHFNAEMSPLELDLYHHMKNIIGVNPSFYEYILMVDADTEVFADSLNVLISTMIHDSRIMGICGETLISNEKESWTTMIQVYEYFISHHLAKAFESLFGSVTCLPGCFCMYRVRTPTKNIPLLVAPAVLQDYSENEVDTLHLKNLLHLGEDRYLTTLMMKNFPNLKLSYTPDAKCKTYVPDRWPVLLSQRRRWINSTVHNLVELVMLPQLCGFCCFSMRFIVFFDLFSTVVQPAALVYIVYLIYSVITSPDQLPLISIIMIALIYGLQAIIFIIKGQWAQIGWMLVYLIATPIFSFYIPIYAFWHFDDFSWGNTRVVVGEKGKKIITADVVPFDPSSIPLKKWGDHERDLWEKGSEHSESHASDISGMSHGSHKFPPPPGSVFGGSVMSGPVYAIPPASTYSPSMYGPPTTYAPSVAPPPPNNRLSMYSNMTAPGPSDEDLLREIRRILSTANLMTVTKKQVRDELSMLFGVDLTPRKSTINHYIEEILQGRL